MKHTAFFVAALLVTAIALPAHAAEVRVGEQITINQNEVIEENIYAAGGQATLSGTVHGDIVVAGGKVIMNSTTFGDAALIGGNIDVLEMVNGDVRSFGGQVTIGESVTGDVVIVGGSVSVLPDVVIGGDLLIVGGDVSMAGTVNGDARIVADSFTLNGLIVGNVNARVRSATFGNDAAIGGDFTYHSKKEIESVGSVVGGAVTFTALKDPNFVPHQKPFTELLTGFVIFQLIIFIIATIAMVLLFPKLSREVGVATTTKKAWKYAAVGFASLVLLPVAAGVLFMSVAGMFLGGIVLIGYVLLIAIAKAMTGITVGAYISRWTKKEAMVSWRWALLGVIVIELLAIIPVVGWIILFVFFIITLGAITFGLYARLKAEHKHS